MAASLALTTNAKQHLEQRVVDVLLCYHRDNPRLVPVLLMTEEQRNLVALV